MEQLDMYDYFIFVDSVEEGLLKIRYYTSSLKRPGKSAPRACRCRMFLDNETPRFLKYLRMMSASWDSGARSAATPPFSITTGGRRSARRETQVA